jgi:hypothetical protein
MDCASARKDSLKVVFVLSDPVTFFSSSSTRTSVALTFSCVTSSTLFISASSSVKKSVSVTSLPSNLAISGMSGVVDSDVTRSPNPDSPCDRPVSLASTKASAAIRSFSRE